MAKKKQTGTRSGLLWRLRRHLNADPGELAVLEQTFSLNERPNLHLAIEEVMEKLPEKPDQLGVLTQHEYDAARLAKMSRASMAKYYEAGSVEYTNVPLADPAGKF